MVTSSHRLAGQSSIPAVPKAGARRWLLFAYQLPSHPSNLRVRTWRRLQQLGAVPIKQAIYVLPDTPSAREDFEWLKAEVKGVGGDASVFVANHVDAWSDDALIEEFRLSRQDAYAALAREMEKCLKRTQTTRPRGSRAPAFGRLIDIFRQRLTAIESVDFFGSAGRDRVVKLLDALESGPRSARASKASSPSDAPTSYHHRPWITRPRPGVDRMASAWLIQRFIDPHARFGFAPDRESVPAEGVPFDMFGVEFTHQGDGCTFETLCAVFGLRDPALARIAGIVHDLDLKDARFNPPEAATVAAVIEGLQLAYADDDTLLAHGMTLFDSLYRSFEQMTRAAGPRPLAKPRKPLTRSQRRRWR